MGLNSLSPFILNAFFEKRVNNHYSHDPSETCQMCNIDSTAIAVTCLSISDEGIPRDFHKKTHSSTRQFIPKMLEKHGPKLLGVSQAMLTQPASDTVNDLPCEATLSTLERSQANDIL